MSLTPTLRPVDRSSAAEEQSGPRGRAAAVTSPPIVSGTRALRNGALTLVAVGIPLASAFLVMPSLASNLGPARFGLLGLAWALLEYFSLFDVGLGRATTKFVAERLYQRKADVWRIIIASSAAQFLLGLAAALLLAVLTPLLVGRVLSVPIGMEDEARSALWLLAAMVPFVILSLGLRGVLEARQRFDISAAIRIPSGASTFLVPAAGAALGIRLPGILALLLGFRILTCVALALAVRHAFASFAWEVGGSWRLPRALVAFGGWVAVTNVISPVLVYLDRFVLGALLGLGAVGIYTPAYELTSRLLIVPGSLITAIFPMVSASWDGRAAQTGRLFSLGIRYLLLVMAPAALVLIVFAPDVLRAWLGAAFANGATGALRILAVGVIINGISHIPFGYLQASGRPDIPAKFHLMEIVLHLPLTCLFIREFGITGAALAWTLRVSLDSMLLFSASKRVLGLSIMRAMNRQGRPTAAALIALVVALSTIAAAQANRMVTVFLIVGALVGFGVTVWLFVLGLDERSSLRRAVRSAVWASDGGELT